MSAALILYGSRARGESRSGSDVDLIFAEVGMSLRSPRTVNGLSVHLYSQDWLEAEARSGSLFAYHVAFEGIALHDDGAFLDRLQSVFRKKPSYRDEIELAALVLRMLIEEDWKDNYAARRRYFWAIRTIIISDAADHGAYIFSSSSLETYSKIKGLAHHIDDREHVTFCSCTKYGNAVLRIVSNVPTMAGRDLRDFLTNVGGIARDSVRIIEEREAIEVGDLAVYL